LKKKPAHPGAAVSICYVDSLFDFLVRSSFVFKYSKTTISEIPTIKKLFSNDERLREFPRNVTCTGKKWVAVESAKAIAINKILFVENLMSFICPLPHYLHND